MMGVSSAVLEIFCLATVVTGQEQCNGELWCEQGHCCGSDGTRCCTYYYELWWFWLIWGLIIMLSCCCLYQQHRLRKRQRRALRALQAGHRDAGFAALPVLGEDGPASSTVESEFRLPTYDEVQDLPKDPPAYELLYEAGQAEPGAAPLPVSDADLVAQVQPPAHSNPPVIPVSDEAGLLDNEMVPEEDPPPAYTAATTTSPSTPGSCRTS